MSGLGTKRLCRCDSRGSLVVLFGAGQSASFDDDIDVFTRSRSRSSRAVCFAWGCALCQTQDVEK